MKNLTKQIEKLIDSGITLEDIAASYQAIEEARNYDKEKYVQLEKIVNDLLAYIQSYHPEIKEYVELKNVTEEDVKELDKDIIEIIQMFKEFKNMNTVLTDFANSLR